MCQPPIRSHFTRFHRAIALTAIRRIGAAMSAATKLGAGQTRRKNMERRDFIKSAGLVAGIAAASTLWSTIRECRDRAATRSKAHGL